MHKSNKLKKFMNQIDKITRCLLYNFQVLETWKMMDSRNKKSMSCQGIQQSVTLGNKQNEIFTFKNQFRKMIKVWITVCLRVDRVSAGEVVLLLSESRSSSSSKSQQWPPSLPCLTYSKHHVRGVRRRRGTEHTYPCHTLILFSSSHSFPRKPNPKVFPSQNPTLTFPTCWSLGPVKSGRERRKSKSA